MTAEGLAVLLGATGLAWANGANDVSKGIATLVGAGVCDCRRAVAWGAACTGVGGLLGAVVAGAMLSTFGGGLLAEGVTPTLAAAVASLVGAAGQVLLSTRTGLPVSTTHAIVGALVGVGVVAFGVDAVAWPLLVGKVLLPLLVSPWVALALTVFLLRILGRSDAATGGSEAAVDCACIDVGDPVPAGVPSPGAAAVARTPPSVVVSTGTSVECATDRPAALAITIGGMHWLTSGATSMARGMNDAPKIVALAVMAAGLSGEASLPLPLLFAVVTAAMVGGSLVGGRRVTRVLAEDVTVMDHREGFVANLVTAALVCTGALHGLPMSTTHVATGGIFGAGVSNRRLDLGTLRRIALAWVVTLPGAALLGALAWGALDGVLR
ncbi:MAG: anion permease [Deltaproteobacteria bacterium]|nr:MAG: anion permease [Deltaproteobacteria bacterium]